MNSRRKVLSSEDKGAFRTAHKEEIEKYEDALNCLKVASPDGTFPPMKELKVESRVYPTSATSRGRHFAHWRGIENRCASLPEMSRPFLVKALYP